MADQKRVMISSTARDLPEHRKQVLEACQRQGMFALRMEDLPANSDEAAAASVKMVEEADIYIGVLANRYGYIPKTNNPDQISVTEVEYNRAVDRKIQRLIFVMDKSHPITVDDVDIENAAKLKAFKERVQTENIVRFFKSPDDLRAEAINSLSKLRQPDLTTFHYVSDIPAPPEEFIAHPYTLLQTHRLIGRQEELKLLTDWITAKELKFNEQKAPPDSVRIMSVVAIGGMGKSALTWKWFKDVAPQEMKNLAGRMWWSFYESDATFENFVIRALAYASKRSIDEVMPIPAPERETQLLNALDHQPFLLVLDGLERILIAYARMDAARLDDSAVGKEKSLRKTADPRVGNFLKKLVQVKQSRVLVSSRLYPAELETVGSDPIPGTFRIRIEGLTDEDAVELWRAFGISGSREELLSVFNTFAKHPLLIQALAGEVKRYRKAPGDFEKWREARARFDPLKFSKTKQAMDHVLQFALRGLNEECRGTLEVIAAFRMPTSYDTLSAVLVGEAKARFNLQTGELIQQETKLFAHEMQLDIALAELEDRALVGWDRRANRYDLHPIVRQVVWNTLSSETRHSVCSNLRVHLESIPTVSSDQVERYDDLIPVVELFNVLIHLGRIEDAFRLLADRIFGPIQFVLSASLQCTELIELLLPLVQHDKSSRRGLMADMLKEFLAISYQFAGYPSKAAALFPAFEGHAEVLAPFPMFYKANALTQCGSLYDAERVFSAAMSKARKISDWTGEAGNLAGVGLTRGIRGDNSCWIPWTRSLAMAEGRSSDITTWVLSYMCQQLVWQNSAAALPTAETTKRWATGRRVEPDIIRSLRLEGEAATLEGDRTRALDVLHEATARARSVTLVEEESRAVITLSDLTRQLGDQVQARDLLDSIWEPVRRGPYRLIDCDALIVLAQIERDAGNNGAAIEAATKAYKLAWCDGPPFSYHWGLEKAKQHLKELGAPEPEMPPFDKSKFEPMPEVEINPHDEFYVDEETLQ